MGAHAYRSGVNKFSSKPPGHDAARQRENQRRHRARVKGRIAELEAALENALQRIGGLTAEVHRLQHALDQSKASSDQTTNTLPLKSPSPSNPDVPDLTTLPPLASDAPSTTCDCPSTCNRLPAPTSPPNPDPTANPALTADLSDPTNDCPLLPASQAGESTIPCRDAYVMVTERTPPEFDLAAATEWLRPGFRRAAAPGAGCRVQTHLLFALHLVTRSFSFSPLITTPSPSPPPSHPHPQHPKMSLGHISLPITSHPTSKTFYTAILAPLNLHLIYDSSATPSSTSTSKTPTLGFGPDPAHEILNLFELGAHALPAGPGFHLAFNAPSREAVVEFHAAAMANGGSDNGLPGVRKQYGERYFAAFVLDPDGWRLEAVCQT
ncbi:hypothetical protein C8A05DRAFT_47269 [Staphylotrichum tortipilum]|uniref:VOC domain-containing protein n=1 Tax=Staphylotrichum tortipilum TaxID=2831512 RepID=A0AAN6RQ66_9PEZI|nr:hypothetical protein C8A05DRAFT_47269 [Staphylotrichum longicolle]